LPFAVYFGLYGLCEFGILTFPGFKGALFDTMQWVYFVFTLLFTALWLYGMMEFCREMGHLRLQGCALRNLMLFAVTYFFDFIARLPIAFVQRYQGYLAAPVLLMRLVVIFLNLYLIFSCYRAFGPEGEELSKNKRREETKDATK
jgi:phosphotransferase system  glucose/maltose/N-acetylglucosamine-specific IIC component